MSLQNCLRSAALSAAILLAGGASAQTEVTLLYDDRGNPVPFKQVYCVISFNPLTGDVSQDWNKFARWPMFDDGKNGDRAPGDGIWGFKAKATPVPGQRFYWATDNTTSDADGWLGEHTWFEVPDGTPITVTGWSMPEESRMTAAEFAAKYAVDLTNAGPPVLLGDGKRVLFRHSARPDARRVFIAGDFNNWGSAQDSRITDGRCVMYQARPGLWYRSVPIDASWAQYKFVEENPDGGFVWLTDPAVPPMDPAGNSLIEKAALRRAASPASSPAAPPIPTPAPAAQAPEWKAYTDSDLAALRSSKGRALVYFRVPESPRCKEFEQAVLLSADMARLLSGHTVLHLDISSGSGADTIRAAGIRSVPAVAWQRPDGTWDSYYPRTAADDGMARELLQRYAAGK